MPKDVPRAVAVLAHEQGRRRIVTGSASTASLDARGQRDGLVADVRAPRHLGAGASPATACSRSATDHFDVDARALRATTAATASSRSTRSRCTTTTRRRTATATPASTWVSRPTPTSRIHDNVSYDNHAEGHPLPRLAGRQDLRQRRLRQLRRDLPARHRRTGFRWRRHRRRQPRARQQPCVPGRARTAPPFSGIGVGILGDHDAKVDGQRDRRATSPAGPSGIPTGGVDRDRHDRVRRHHADEQHASRTTASPATSPDVFWDGTGTGNRFDGNHCSTSTPPGLCA